MSIMDKNTLKSGRFSSNKHRNKAGLQKLFGAITRQSDVVKPEWGINVTPLRIGVVVEIINPGEISI